MTSIFEKEWIKIGRIYSPPNDNSWMHSHASVPFAFLKENNEHRIFFSPRCANNISRVGWLDINLDNPKLILDISKRPYIEEGKLGTYCDTGIMPSWILFNNSTNKYHFFFIGWTKRITVPFHQAIGEIVIDKITKYTNFESYPIMDRSPSDPFYVSNPCVVKKGKKFYMYYLSCLGWFDKLSPKSKYCIKVAVSDDLKTWCENENFLFPMQNIIAYARPSVIIIDNIFHMWFSVRKSKRDYIIKHATSKDGLKFDIDNSLRLYPSEKGWDSEMVAYPHVFKFKKDIFMLYCGNGYSSSGFGLAKIRRK